MDEAKMLWIRPLSWHPGVDRTGIYSETITPIGRFRIERCGGVFVATDGVGRSNFESEEAARQGVEAVICKRIANMLEPSMFELMKDEIAELRADNARLQEALDKLLAEDGK